MEKSYIQKQRLLQPSIDYSTNSDIKDDMLQQLNVKLSKRNSEKDVRLRTIESHLPLKKVLFLIV